MLQGVDDGSSAAFFEPIDEQRVRGACSSAAAPKSQPTLKPPDHCQLVLCMRAFLLLITRAALATCGCV